MKHPYQKFMHMQYGMMGVTLILGILALVNGSPLLALLTCFALALSFIFEGIVEWKKQHAFQFAQQILRATVILIFMCYLYF